MAARSAGTPARLPVGLGGKTAAGGHHVVRWLRAMLLIVLSSLASSDSGASAVLLNEPSASRVIVSPVFLQESAVVEKATYQSHQRLPCHGSQFMSQRGESLLIQAFSCRRGGVAYIRLQRLHSILKIVRPECSKTWQHACPGNQQVINGYEKSHDEACSWGQRCLTRIHRMLKRYPTPLMLSIIC